MWSFAQNRPTRRRPGSAPTSSANGRAGGGAGAGSPGSYPATQSSTAAVSRTVRVMTCSVTHPLQPSPMSGPSVTRPRDGLSPTAPTAPAGIADRTAAVARVGQADDARRDRGRRAAARPADDAIGVPRVAGRAERVGLGRRRQPELGCVRLAEHHEARGAEPLDEGAVVRRDPVVIAQEPGAAVLRGAAELRPEVLQEQRHAAERPVADRAGGQLLACEVVERDDHRVQRRVEPLDRVDARLEQLRGRAFTRPHQLGLRGRVEGGELEVRRGHGGSLPGRCSPRRVEVSVP